MKDLILPNTCINLHVIQDKGWFEMLVKQLKKMYSMVSIEELYSYYYEGIPLKNACHITFDDRSEEHTSELQSRGHLVCRLLLEKKNNTDTRSSEIRAKP